jgi:hypothetical protein
MFVQINDAYARIRRGLSGRRPSGQSRYVRKSKVAERTVYGREPGRHAASTVRPSYSHPSNRRRRAVRALLTSRRPRVGARESVPPRSARLAGQRVNATVRAWLADRQHPRRSHRHPDAPHRRQHTYLPCIGWCWVTDEYPKVTV